MNVLRKLAGLVVASTLSACAKDGTPIGAIDTSCEAYKNITYSRRDTKQTKREVRAHNRVYDELCK